MAQDEGEAGAGAPFRLGWEEWAALPDLGLPALKAKIDTGTRTSALHATDIEAFGAASRPRVRFTVTPVPGRADLAIPCSADIADRREVTGADGAAALHYIVSTDIALGARRWPIEIALTDRGGMAHRMVLGRQGLPEETVISPTDSACQGTLSYELYSAAKLRRASPRRALRVAILSREPNNHTTRRIAAEGEGRGHVVEVIDTARCYMALETLAPEVHYDGKRLPRYDAVIPRIGASLTAYGAAVTRQFETIGTFCVNGSEGIVASRDKLYAHQILARHRIGMPMTAFAASPKDTNNLIGLVGSAPLIVKLLESTQGKGVVLAETKKAAESVITAFRGLRASFLVQQFVRESAGEDIRCLVIGGRVVAAMRRTGAADDFRSNLHQGGGAERVRITRAERDAAVRAARAFRLACAGVDLLRASDGPKVLEVNSSPGFEGIEKASGKSVAGALFDLIERSARPAPPRRQGRSTGARKTEGG